MIYNALVHNDENVVVKIRVDTGPESHTRISISDNGHGIPAKDLEQIFERYYRGTNTTSKHGTGLGMAIARDIIWAHEGKLDMTSIENTGTTITILL